MANSDIVEYKRKLGRRIRQARIAAGYRIVADLSILFPDWSTTRIGNYEGGVSYPNPLDLLRIAEATSSNPCWLYFEKGSMFRDDLTIHDIRRINFVRIYNALRNQEKAQFPSLLKISKRELKKIMDGKPNNLTSSLCRKIENRCGLEKKDMDTLPGYGVASVKKS